MTNEFGTSFVQAPSGANVKLEPTNDGLMVLSHFEDDICVDVEFFYTSHFHLEVEIPPFQNFVP